MLAKVLMFGGILSKVLIGMSTFGRARVSGALGGIFECLLPKALI
jgi:hypothetical protein